MFFCLFVYLCCYSFYIGVVVFSCWSFCCKCSCSCLFVGVVVYERCYYYYFVIAIINSHCEVIKLLVN
jgi:hypothetical protein